MFTHTGAPTFGTTALDVAQFSGAGQVVAGDALSKSGNTLNVEVDDASIEVSSDALRVKALGIQNSMIANNTIATTKLANPFIRITDESSTTGQVSLEENLDFLEHYSPLDFLLDDSYEEKLNILLVFSVKVFS